MARSSRMEEEEQDLNLAPIMNMVIILIPLLLLSVVFIEVSVINITAPKLAVGAPSEAPPPEDKPLNLTVAIGAKGFMISAEGGNLPPVPGCPQEGPTLCLRPDKNIDVNAKFTEAREAMAQKRASMNEGEKVIKEALTAYNWMELYGQLVKIKKKFPKETIVNLSADPNIPFGAIVRLMDVARYQLDEESYADRGKFWEAAPLKDGKGYKGLFGDPVLSLVK